MFYSGVIGSPGLEPKRVQVCKDKNKLSSSVNTFEHTLNMLRGKYKLRDKGTHSW
jgi:hypothetical protein